MPGGQGFDGDHQHPEPPVHPADGKTGPGPDGLVGVGRKRTGVGVGHGHLAEHAHHQDHQQARQHIGQDCRGPGGGNCMPGADEQAGANDAGDGKHGDMAWLETLRQLTARILGAQADHYIYSLVIGTHGIDCWRHLTCAA
ncbi:hypothetical protein D3C79_856170 [compost metagenome]